MFGSGAVWVSGLLSVFPNLQKNLFLPNVWNRTTHWCGKFGKKVIIFVEVIPKNVDFRKYFFLFLKLTIKFRNFKVFINFFNWHHLKALSIYFRTTSFFFSIVALFLHNQNNNEVSFCGAVWVSTFFREKQLFWAEPTKEENYYPTTLVLWNFIDFNLLKIRKNHNFRKKIKFWIYLVITKAEI